MRQGRSKAAESTRAAIIEAAMRGFAEKGFGATSTREIAAAAGTNVASIAYHFGGKEGLRTACAEAVVDLLGGVVQQAQAQEPPDDPQAARSALTTLVRRLVAFLLLEPQARTIVGFMLRELSEPSPALDLIYERLFQSAHRRACTIWGIATGRDPESPAVRLGVFSTIGQIVYFNLARPVVQRRMDWPAIGPDEAAAITDAVVRNLNARLDADTGDRP
jgi:AcrR family transcriptional regulator